MQRSTKIIIALVLTLGIAGAATAVGKHRFGNPEKRATHMVNYISDELNLDATQQQALSVFKDQLLSSRKAIHSDMAGLREEATSLLTAEVFDRAQALDLVNARTAQVNAIAPEIVGSLGDFLDTLDAEQKARVSDFVENHRHRRHRH